MGISGADGSNFWEKRKIYEPSPAKRSSATNPAVNSAEDQLRTLIDLIIRGDSNAKTALSFIVPDDSIRELVETQLLDMAESVFKRNQRGDLDRTLIDKKTAEGLKKVLRSGLLETLNTDDIQNAVIVYAVTQACYEVDKAISHAGTAAKKVELTLDAKRNFELLIPQYFTTVPDMNLGNTSHRGALIEAFKKLNDLHHRTNIAKYFQAQSKLKISDPQKFLEDLDNLARLKQQIDDKATLELKTLRQQSADELERKYCELLKTAGLNALHSLGKISLYNKLLADEVTGQDRQVKTAIYDGFNQNSGILGTIIKVQRTLENMIRPKSSDDDGGDQGSSERVPVGGPYRGPVLARALSAN
jgi:hypothetical protein